MNVYVLHAVDDHGTVHTYHLANRATAPTVEEAEALLRKQLVVAPATTLRVTRVEEAWVLDERRPAVTLSPEAVVTVVLAVVGLTLACVFGEAGLSVLHLLGLAWSWAGVTMHTLGNKMLPRWPAGWNVALLLLLSFLYMTHVGMLATWLHLTLAVPQALTYLAGALAPLTLNRVVRDY